MSDHRMVDVEIVKETDKAILAESEEIDDATGEPSLWIPKSVISDESPIWREGEYGSLIIEGWFAEKAGLI